MESDKKHIKVLQKLLKIPKCFFSIELLEEWQKLLRMFGCKNWLKKNLILNLHNRKKV